MKKSFLIITSVMLLLSGCSKENKSDADDYIVNVLPSVGDSLKADITGGALMINQVRIGLYPDGNLTNDCKNTFPFFQVGNSFSNLSSSRLWLGADDMNPPQICVNNFSTIWDNKEHGVYTITPQNINQVKTNGFVARGFPSVNGEARLLGDAMLWLQLKGSSGTSLINSNPVQDVLVSMSVYAFKRDDLKNLLFIRYDIKNTGSRDLNKVYAGYRSDTDMYGVNGNCTGYISSHAFTYTYIKPGTFRTNEDSTYKQIAGFTFLKSPLEDAGIPFGVSSHRIARKNDYINPEFGEYNMGLNEAMYALKGMSNNNTPMIDPVTKQPTMYAFTGDPVLGTGWLDTPVDTRNMINAGPFSLKAGESKTLVVLWLCAAETTLAQSLEKAKKQLETVRNEKALWQ